MGLLHGRGSSGRKRGRQAVADRQPACGGREAVVPTAAAGGDVVSQGETGRKQIHEAGVRGGRQFAATGRKQVRNSGAFAGEHAGPTASRGGRGGRQSAAQKLLTKKTAH